MNLWAGQADAEWSVDEPRQTQWYSCFGCVNRRHTIDYIIKTPVPSNSNWARNKVGRGKWYIIGNVHIVEDREQILIQGLRGVKADMLSPYISLEKAVRLECVSKIGPVGPHRILIFTSMEETGRRFLTVSPPLDVDLRR